MIEGILQLSRVLLARRFIEAKRLRCPDDNDAGCAGCFGKRRGRATHSESVHRPLLEPGIGPAVLTVRVAHEEVRLRGDRREWWRAESDPILDAARELQ